MKKNKNIEKIKNIPLVIPMYMFFKKIILYTQYWSDLFHYRNKNNNGRFDVNFKELIAYIYDKTKIINFEPHYTYHPAWAARIIAKIKPQKHIDISSILHFSTIVSAFIPVDFYDYRPAEVFLDNLNCKKGNLLSLPFVDNSVESISCMHTIEHIGLGRYGDDIDPDGDIKAINELKRVTSIDGNLIIAIPIGKPKIIFNAHRIYSYDQIISYFKDFELKEFSLIPDDAIKTGMIYNATKEQADEQNYGCGCFWFIKK